MTTTATGTGVELGPPGEVLSFVRIEGVADEAAEARILMQAGDAPSSGRDRVVEVGRRQGRDEAGFPAWIGVSRRSGLSVLDAWMGS